MIVFKCKMCGGTIEKIEDGIGVCEFCGTKQTISHTNEEKKMNLLDRANHFRIQNDFDKAMVIYEQILEEDTTDSDIYYSLALCKYGITYVDDIKTNKKIPTINRMQNRQFTKDPDYIMAIEKAYIGQKHIYEEEGEYIDKVQNEILDITKNEDPYEIFICYKEADEYGKRTKDSVLANELYYELVNVGYKVFFSKITLEGKLGIAYEPYIFAALQSSKVMVVISTKKEYVNSPWVKNEWSRFLSFINEGQKKILIPAYRDMDPYDLPEEFVNLQAQDMSKLGFMQDLLRGIKKIIGEEQNENSKSSVRALGNDKIQSLLKRVKVFMDDEEWEKADEYCEKALDIDAENPDIYLYKFLIDLKKKNIEGIKQCDRDFRDISNNFNKLIKYSNEEKKKYYNELNYNYMYEDACISMKNKAYDRAIGIFEKITDYKDSEEKIKECKEIICCNRYEKACKSMNEGNFGNAKSMFREIIDYKDSKEKLTECKYKDADRCMNNFMYETAIDKFQEIVDYKDSKDKIIECKYRNACQIMNGYFYSSASKIFKEIEYYKDSKEKFNECLYKIACEDMSLQRYNIAKEEFEEIKGYKDSEKKIKECERIELKEERKKEFASSICLTIRMAILIIILFLIVMAIIKM